MREKIKLQNPSNYKLIFFEKLNRLFVRSFIDFQNHLTIKKQFLFELDLINLNKITGKFLLK